MAILEVKNLSIQFGGLHAVDNFNIQINQGELYGLIGPNGAGKTSLIDCLLGDKFVSSGRHSRICTNRSSIKAACFYLASRK